MSKELLNEAERFLLQNWPDARALEESMESVREKYKEVFQRLGESVLQRYPMLDTFAAFPNQFWDSGTIGFSRKLWAAGDDLLPPGIWFDGLRLEKLSSDADPHPTVSLWFKTARKAGIDLAAVRQRVHAAVPELLTVAERPAYFLADNDAAPLKADLPEKAELITLFAQGDAQPFIDCLLARVEPLSRFLPLLDGLLRRPT